MYIMIIYKDKNNGEKTVIYPKRTALDPKND